jgi:hypothetical protein
MCVLAGKIEGRTIGYGTRETLTLLVWLVKDVAKIYFDMFGQRYEKCDVEYNKLGEPHDLISGRVSIWLFVFTFLLAAWVRVETNQAVKISAWLSDHSFRAVKPICRWSYCSLPEISSSRT